MAEKRSWTSRLADIAFALGNRPDIIESRRRSRADMLREQAAAERQAKKDEQDAKVFDLQKQKHEDDLAEAKAKREATANLRLKLDELEANKVIDQKQKAVLEALPDDRLASSLQRMFEQAEEFQSKLHLEKSLAGIRVGDSLDRERQKLALDKDLADYRTKNELKLIEARRGGGLTPEAAKALQSYTPEEAEATIAELVRSGNLEAANEVAKAIRFERGISARASAAAAKTEAIQNRDERFWSRKMTAKEADTQTKLTEQINKLESDLAEAQDAGATAKTRDILRRKKILEAQLGEILDRQDKVYREETLNQESDLDRRRVETLMKSRGLSREAAINELRRFKESLSGR